MAIAQALMNSYSYAEYRKAVTVSIARMKSGTEDPLDEYYHYTVLNESRMNRLDKTITISADVISAMLTLKKHYVWLVLSEGWCGDAAQLLPIMNKMAIVAPNIDLKIVFRDENVPLMDKFLTNGARSIPKLIVLDAETSAELASWGPRPKGAANLITSYKQQYGSIDETAKTELQLWYLHDKGLSTQQELCALMRDAEGHFTK